MRIACLLPGVLGLASLAGCAAPAATDRVVISANAAPHADPGAATCSPAASSVPALAMCTDRFAQVESETAGANVNALLFGTCETFLPAFLDVVRSSCSEAAPELVKAIVAEQAARLLPGAAERTNDAFYLDLARASRPFVPDGCRRSFPTDDEDVGRQIFEIKKDWRECYPDPELLGAFTRDRGAIVTYASSSIVAAEYFWALGIAPHMTPLGKQFLRKFLVCGQYQATPSFIQAWPETEYPYADQQGEAEEPAPKAVTKPTVSRHPPQR